MEFYLFVALMGVLGLSWGILELEARFRANEAERSVRAYKRQQAKMAKALSR
jgi:hypothetical protein